MEQQEQSMNEKRFLEFMEHTIKGFEEIRVELERLEAKIERIRDAGNDTPEDK